MTPDRSFPWEGQAPDHNAYGFLAVRGTVQMYLGYAVFGSAVLLYVNEQIADTQPRQWIRFWTSRDRALEQAEQLVERVDEYLNRFKPMPLRSYEDLDSDDFLDHLKARLNNELH